MKKILYTICLALLIICTNSYATPQFSLSTGNRCAVCHTNYQGSGTRTEFGWNTARGFSIVNWDTLVGLNNIPPYSFTSNSILDGKVSFSGDYRLQSSRSIRPGAERKWLSKQINIGTTIDVASFLNLDFSYNFAENYYKNYGQNPWTASAIFMHPDYDLTLRVGKFQPSIGLRYDDHTSLIRLLANSFVYSSPIIAVDYSDFGAEASYDAINHNNQYVLNFVGGVFSTSNFERVLINARKGMESIINGAQPSYIAKATFYENKGISDFTNSYLGASLFINNDLKMANTFGGVNFYNRVSLFGEFSHSYKNSIFTTNNAIAGVNFRVNDGLYLECRADQALTNYIGAKYDAKTRQLIFSARAFPLPFVELIPEFRLVDTEQKPQYMTQYKAGVFFFQTHIFF
jgi:hypothetical protein